MLHLGLSLVVLVATAGKAPKLDGKWEVARMEMMGEELSRRDWSMKDVVFKGDKVEIAHAYRYFSSFSNDHFVDASKGYKLKLDPKATPMQMDIFDEWGFARECIYKFDKDKLIIALHTKGKRPKDFKEPEIPRKIVDPDAWLSADDPFTLVTLERAK